MTLPEKVAYIKGLAEGLSLDDSKESKLIKAIIDCLEDISDNLTDCEDDIIELGEQLDEVDEDLAALEDEVYCEDEEEEDEDDDTYYEVTCPSCNETICLDEETLLDGGIACPNCGEELEFDFDCDGECDGCDSCDED